LRWLPPSLFSDLGLRRGDGEAAARDERPRVVLADDNADMRDYVRRLLAAAMWSKSSSWRGGAGRGPVEAGPDLVLTDRNDAASRWPWAFCRRSAPYPELRDCRDLLSARAGEESRDERRAADDYLIKPFSARELVARIGAALELARVRRQAADALRASEARLRALVNALPSR